MTNVTRLVQLQIFAYKIVDRLHAQRALDGGIHFHWNSIDDIQLTCAGRVVTKWGVCFTGGIVDHFRCVRSVNAWLKANLKINWRCTFICSLTLIKGKREEYCTVQSNQPNRLCWWFESCIRGSRSWKCRYESNRLLRRKSYFEF